MKKDSTDSRKINNSCTIAAAAAAGAAANALYCKASRASEPPPAHDTLQQLYSRVDFLAVSVQLGDSIAHLEILFTCINSAL